ncbi:MAG: c-type cytochrome [Kiloniellales bacterium]
MTVRDKFLGCLGLAAAAAAVTAGGVALAGADASVVTVRQGVMTGQVDHAKAIIAFIKEDLGTSADVAKRAGGIAATTRLIPGLFPKGTGMDEIKDPRTGAKPEIWLDWAGFEKAAKALETEAEKLMQVALGGDKDAIAAQFGVMGKQGCGGCHKPFREKLE